MISWQAHEAYEKGLRPTGWPGQASERESLKYPFLTCLTPTHPLDIRRDLPGQAVCGKIRKNAVGKSV